MMIKPEDFIEGYENKSFVRLENGAMASNNKRSICREVLITNIVDQFEMFSIYQVLPQILELWGDNLMTDVQAKKGLAEVSGK